MNGLLNFPNEKGDILTIQHLDGIIPLCSEVPLFTAQAAQLFQEKEMEFILTCQNFLCSTYRLFNPEAASLKQDCVLDGSQKSAALFPAISISCAPCKTTSVNTYFNFSDAEINPTRASFGENSSDTLCKSSTCFDFHEFSPYICDNILSSAHWCNHSKLT